MKLHGRHLHATISTPCYLAHATFKKNMSKDESCERNGQIHCVNENWDILVTAEWSNLLPLAFVETTFVTPHHTCACNTFTPSSHKNCGPSARTNTNKKHFLANLWHIQIWTIHHHCQVQAPFCTGFLFIYFIWTGFYPGCCALKISTSICPKKSHATSSLKNQGDPGSHRFSNMAFWPTFQYI